MNDHDVINEMLRLHSHIATVDTPLADDVARGRRRLWRRRAATTLVAAAAAVLTVGLMQGSPWLQSEPAPAGPLSPSPTPSGARMAERIRAEGVAVDPGGRSGVNISSTESGLTVTRYVLCDTPPCSPGPFTYTAVEVAMEGQAAVYQVPGDDPWVELLDGGSVLMQDSQDPQMPASYAVLDALGHIRWLRLVPDPVSAVAGPGVVRLDLWGEWTSGMIPEEDLYYVDEQAGTIQALAIPPSVDVAHWGPNVNEQLWGVRDCLVTWQEPTGGFSHTQVSGCGERGDIITDIPRNAFPPGWLQQGRMAFTEETAQDVTLHVSLDNGATWQSISHTTYDAAITNALQGLP